MQISVVSAGDRGLVVFEIEMLNQAVKKMKELLEQAPKSAVIVKAEDVLKEARTVMMRDLPVIQPLQTIQYKRYFDLSCKTGISKWVMYGLFSYL